MLGLQVWTVLIRFQTKSPRNCFADCLHIWWHSQEVFLKRAINFRSAVSDSHHGDRFIIWKLLKVQSSKLSLISNSCACFAQIIANAKLVDKSSPQLDIPFFIDALASQISGRLNHFPGHGQVSPGEDFVAIGKLDCWSTLVMQSAEFIKADFRNSTNENSSSQRRVRKTTTHQHAQVRQSRTNFLWKLIPKHVRYDRIAGCRVARP